MLIEKYGQTLSFFGETNLNMHRPTHKRLSEKTSVDHGCSAESFQNTLYGKHLKYLKADTKPVLVNTFDEVSLNQAFVPATRPMNLIATVLIADLACLLAFFILIFMGYGWGTAILGYFFGGLLGLFVAVLLMR